MRIRARGARPQPARPRNTDGRAHAAGPAAPGGRPRHGALPWAAPSTADWQVLLLGTALIVGGLFAGLSLMRDLGVLMAALTAAGLLAGWVLALVARPDLQQIVPGGVCAG